MGLRFAKSSGFMPAQDKPQVMHPPRGLGGSSPPAQPGKQGGAFKR